MFDSRLLEGGVLSGDMKAPIRRDQFGRVPENRLMVGHRALQFVPLPFACRQDSYQRISAGKRSPR